MWKASIFQTDEQEKTFWVHGKQTRRGETEGVKRRYQVRFSWSSGVTSAEEVSGRDWKF